MAAQAVPTVTLGSVYLEITNVCNYRCISCYNDSRNDNSNYMDLDTIVHLIQEQSRLGSKSLALSGGEPFLHPNIWEIIDCASQNGLSILLITNGSLLSDEAIKKAMHYQVSFQISVDGYNEDINDKTRGRGTFRQTFSSLEKIRDNDYGKKASIRCTLNQNNMHALDGYTKLAKEMGLYELSFGWMTPSGRGATCFSDVGLFAEEYKSVAQRIKALQQSSDAEGLLISGLEISLSCPMIANDDSAALNMHINSFGEVYLCSQLMIDAFCLGNIHEQSIEEILHHDRTYEILYRLRERQSWDVEDCSTCFLKRKCKRGCPGLAIRFGGLMHSDGQCLPRKQVMAEVMRTPR